MFDDDFDPLGDLEACILAINTLNTNIERLIVATNRNSREIATLQRQQQSLNLRLHQLEKRFDKTNTLAEPRSKRPQ